MTDEADVVERRPPPVPTPRGDAPTRERTDQPREQQERGKQEAAPREPEDKNGGDGKKGAGQRRRSPIGLIILAIVIVIGGLGGFYYWFTTRDLQSTDDAYTDGRAITIAPQVSGVVVSLDVTDNEFVHAGQRLIKIDPRDFIASRDQAQGALELAQAQLENARINLDMTRVTAPAKLKTAQAQLDNARANQINAQAEFRRQHSVDPAATTRQNVDQATAGSAQAAAQVALQDAQVQQNNVVPLEIAQAQAQVLQWEAQVVQAKAQLDTATLNLSYTDVLAPQDGWITKRNVEKGNYVQTGGSLFSIVAPEVWVTANFKETELTRMRPGDPVDISVDAYPFLKLRGHVNSVQMGSGSKFSAFPAENATGNFVKIVQRVPVKITIDSGLDPKIPLPLGISVEPTVHLPAGPAPR